MISSSMKIENTYYKISEIIASELSGKISSKEKEFLAKWLEKSPENLTIYTEIKKESWYKNQRELFDKFSAQEAWDRINPKITVKTKTRNIYLQIAKYAALIILLLSSGFYLKSYFSDPKDTVQLAQPLIAPGIKGAKLVLDSGEEIMLSSNNSFQLKESDGTLIEKDSGLINYANNNLSQKEIFNTIQTTRGEEFSLVLSDGTKVYLNADSKIKFPVNFIKDERNVEVAGEVFFDVAHDATHPFIVSTEKSMIQVLGTSFNIKAYANEISEITTLVKGSINIRNRYDEQSAIILKPGDQASVISDNHKIAVKQVDPAYFMAWKEGKFVFKDERLENIIRDLQRWYDFEVVFENEAVKDIRFGARIDRYTEVNTVFNIMNNTGLITSIQNENKFTFTMNEK